MNIELSNCVRLLARAIATLITYSSSAQAQELGGIDPLPAKGRRNLPEQQSRSGGRSIVEID